MIDSVGNHVFSLWRKTWCQRVVVAVVYVVLALATTWPLMQSPWVSLPMGTTQAVTVPLFNLWTIWWNADRALHGFAGYWNAPIFHPTTDAFAFSELQLTTLVVAPVIWSTGSRVLAYNVYLWLSLVLNGVFAESLLRTLKVRSWAAIAGGATMVMLPIVHWQLDVIQLAPIWGVLWCWSACCRATRLSETARWPTALIRGVEVGTALSITFHACGHHGLFLGLLAVATGWVLPRRWSDRRLWLAIVAAGVVVLVTVGPFAMHMSRVMKAHNFVRNDALIGSLSALPQDFLAAPGAELLSFGAKWCRSYWRLSPGWLKVGLAVVGAVLGLSRRRTRRWTLFLLLTIGLSFALSLGMNLKWGAWQAWPLLAKYVPGLAQVRNVFRFAFFTQIAIVILAIQAVWWLWLRWRVWCLRRVASVSVALLTADQGRETQRYADHRVTLRIDFRRWSMQVGFLTLAGTAAFEVCPNRLVLCGAPNESVNAAWIDFIKQQTPPDSGIVCLPFPKAYECSDFESATRWMYYGTFHGVPMVNGYSGFFPLHYFQTQDSLNNPASYAAVLSKLAVDRVHFVVMSQEPGSPEPLRTATFGLMQLELVFADPCGVSVYRLRRLPPPAAMSFVFPRITH